MFVITNIKNECIRTLNNTNGYFNAVEDFSFQCRANIFVTKLAAVFNTSRSGVGKEFSYDINYGVFILCIEFLKKLSEDIKSYLTKADMVVVVILAMYRLANS